MGRGRVVVRFLDGSTKEVRRAPSVENISKRGDMYFINFGEFEIGFDEDTLFTIIDTLVTLLPESELKKAQSPRGKS